MRNFFVIIKLLTVDFIFAYLVLGCIPITFYWSRYQSLNRDFYVGKGGVLYLVLLFMLFCVILILDAFFTILVVYRSNKKQADRNLISTIIILFVDGYFMYMLTESLPMPDTDALLLKATGFCVDAALSVLVFFAYKHLHKKLFENEGDTELNYWER